MSYYYPAGCTPADIDRQAAGGDCPRCGDGTSETLCSRCVWEEYEEDKAADREDREREGSRWGWED